MTNDHPSPFRSYCVPITRVFRFLVILQLLSYTCLPYMYLFVYMVAMNTTVSSELLHGRMHFALYSFRIKHTLIFQVFVAKNSLQMELYEKICCRKCEHTIIFIDGNFPNYSSELSGGKIHDSLYNKFHGKGWWQWLSHAHAIDRKIDQVKTLSPNLKLSLKTTSCEPTCTIFRNSFH